MAAQGVRPVGAAHSFRASVVRCGAFVPRERGSVWRVRSARAWFGVARSFRASVVKVAAWCGASGGRADNGAVTAEHYFSAEPAAPARRGRVEFSVGGRSYALAA